MCPKILAEWSPRYQEMAELSKKSCIVRLSVAQWITALINPPYLTSLSPLPAKPDNECKIQATAAPSKINQINHVPSISNWLPGSCCHPPENHYTGLGAGLYYRMVINENCPQATPALHGILQTCAVLQGLV